MEVSSEGSSRRDSRLAASAASIQRCVESATANGRGPEPIHLGSEPRVAGLLVYFFFRFSFAHLFVAARDAFPLISSSVSFSRRVRHPFRDAFVIPCSPNFSARAGPP